MAPDPSMFALVAAQPQNSTQQTLDQLNFLGTQIEQTLLNFSIPAHIFAGIHSFSAFDLVAPQYAELARISPKITVFGEADQTPRSIPNIEYIALPAGSTLSHERFLIVNHGQWQVMLLAQTTADSDRRIERQRRYSATLTFASSTVERGAMIASMLAGQQVQRIGRADPFSQQMFIAYLVLRTAQLGRMVNFEPQGIFTEVPSLIELARQTVMPNAFSERLQTLIRQAQGMARLDGIHIYRHEGMMTRPILSTMRLDLVAGVVAGQGPVGEAVQMLQPRLLRTANETIAAYPIFEPASRKLWGAVAFQVQRPDALQNPSESLPLAVILGAITSLIHEELLHKAADVDSMPLPRVEPINLETDAQAFSPPPKPEQAPPQPAPLMGRGRIRLGKGRENNNQPGDSSSQLEVARLPEVAPVEVEMDPFEDYQRRMIAHLVRFDRDGADRVWREAYAKFSARELCINLLQPIQIAIGEGWHRGEVSIAAEHFSTGYITSKIVSFLNSYPDNPNGQIILTGCVQGETHETGMMMLSLFLRWQGYKVIYLGANVPNSTLYDAITTINPDMLLLSATMKENGNNMTEVAHIMARVPDPKPIFGYGGAAFIFFPELRDRVNGYYLGDDPVSILGNIKNLLDTRRMNIKRMS